MSGIFGSTTIKGTRITDFAKTSADVGTTIPFLYGRAPVNGNVIFAHLPPDEHRQVKRQGKGGVKQESFTYTTSYAIAFCRGPIQGYWWIKRNGKVVYSQDPAAPIEDKDYAAKWAAKVMMYNGTSGQLPNSMIESYKGSGRVSAFKYLAYIAVPNEDVTEGGGAIPSYEAVPIASPQEVWITSTPYAQIFYDDARAALAPTGGDLRRLLFEATMHSDEVTTGLAPSGGMLFEVPPPEFHDEGTAALAPTGGELKEPPPGRFYEAAVPTLAPSGGTLATPPTGTMQKDELVPTLAPSDGVLFTPDKFWSPTDKSASALVFETNKVVQANGATNATRWARSVKSKNAGKWRIQFVLDTMGPQCAVGFATSAALGTYLGQTAAGWALWGNYAGPQLRAYNNNAFTAINSQSFTTGDVIDLLLDIDAGKAWYRKNGVVLGGDPVAGTGQVATFTAGTTLFIAADSYNASTIRLRSLAADMTGSAVSGFTDGWDD